MEEVDLTCCRYRDVAVVCWIMGLKIALLGADTGSRGIGAQTSKSKIESSKASA
jgi:hypothetical protein